MTVQVNVFQQYSMRAALLHSFSLLFGNVGKLAFNKQIVS